MSNSKNKILIELRNMGWDLKRDSQGFYHTTYKGKNTDLKVKLSIDSSKKIISVIAYLFVNVDTAGIDRIIKFLNELNLRTFFGSFEMNIENQQIAYRTGIIYSDMKLQMRMVLNCLNAATYYLDRGYNEILKVDENEI